MTLNISIKRSRWFPKSFRFVSSLNQSYCKSSKL
nr:MAG TPA: hypothetical protein [Caudoviricetes sp.]DAX71731.1 MAG TPA: hypothetical protein [Caudoviricetes sp.]